MLPINTLVQGRYTIIEPLEHGGRGAIYKAIDNRLRRQVTLKQLPHSGDHIGHQFEYEAHLLVNLGHPALPRVTDYFSDDSGHFLVMDYIHGNDLGKLILRHGPFPTDDVLRWANQLLDALAYLHTRRPPIIHRDIKPQNLKLTDRGEIILLDFGLATGVVAQTGVAYTPYYAPLEQMQGAGADARSDLYSLAATLYHLLAGRPPVDARIRAVARSKEEPDPLTPLGTLAPSVPPSVVNTLTHALALRPDQRPPSAAAMYEGLHGAADRANAPITGHCPYCDSPVREGTRFCLECGTPLAPKTRPVPPAASPMLVPLPASAPQPLQGSTPRHEPSPARPVVTSPKTIAQPHKPAVVPERPHLNTRFEGVRRGSALPVRVRVPLAVWVGGQIEQRRGQSSAQFRYEFREREQSFRVRVQADEASWTIDDLQTTMIVEAPTTNHPAGRTRQEAMFWITALHPARTTFYITVARADDGAEVQHVWIDVVASEPPLKALMRWWHNLWRPATTPQPPLERSLATPRITTPLSDPPSAHPAPPPMPLPAPSVGAPPIPTPTPGNRQPLAQSVVPPVAPTMHQTRHATMKSMVNSPALTPQIRRYTHPSPRRKSRQPARVTLPFDARGISPRTVRITVQRASDVAGAYTLFVAARLPGKELYNAYHIPLGLHDIQNLTDALRQQLEAIVFYKTPLGQQPYIALDALHIDEQIAQTAMTPLADVGYQAWTALFNKGRAAPELRQLAADLRTLPHGSTIQIVLDNPEFILPWALLYDAPELPMPGTVRWEGFWGYRYAIDVLPRGEYPEPLLPPHPDALQLLSDDEGLQGFTQAQEQLLSRRRERLRSDSRRGQHAIDRLTASHRASVVYCYCHGEHHSGAVRMGDLPGNAELNFGSASVRLADLERTQSRFEGQPIVFLNACEGATQQPLYYDGFMPYFMETRGARAFIGAEVKTPQYLAHDFSLQFWQHLAQGEPLSVILWKLRRHYADTYNNALAFNYSLYGHGDVRLP